jgi:membrane protease YdiL (CAAX protease family)
MNNFSNDEQHSWIKSVALHLLPGVVIALVYFNLRGPVINIGYPSVMALMLAIVIALVPFELGYLLFVGYRKNNRISLKGVVEYRNSIPLWNYLIIVPSLFIVLGMIFTLLKPIDKFLYDYLFFWIPKLESGLTADYGKNTLIITYSLMALFGMIIGPIVEELYFRGYLLPKMKFAGKYDVVLHSFLFAIYHLFTPWMIITRTIGMIPLAYIVKKKNINIGIIVHILINSIDIIMGILFITSIGLAVVR